MNDIHARIRRRVSGVDVYRDALGLALLLSHFAVEERVRDNPAAYKEPPSDDVNMSHALSISRRP